MTGPEDLEPRVLDLRLAPVALGAWLGGYIALRTGLTVAVIAVAISLVAGAVVAWLPRIGSEARVFQRHQRRPQNALGLIWIGHAARQRWNQRDDYGDAHAARRLDRGDAKTPTWYASAWRPVAAAGLLGLVIGTVAAGARLVTRDDPALAELARDRVTAEITLTITDDPHRSRGGTETWVVPARLREVRLPDGTALRTGARVVLLATNPQWNGLLPGQRVRTVGRLGTSLGGDLRAAVVSVSQPPEPAGEPPWVQRAAGGLRAGLRHACVGLDPRPGGLLPGLVVGDISRLSPAVAQDFVDTGMTHLTAVSGGSVN